MLLFDPCHSIDEIKKFSQCWMAGKVFEGHVPKQTSCAMWHETLVFAGKTDASSMNSRKIFLFTVTAFLLKNSSLFLPRWVHVN